MKHERILIRNQLSTYLLTRWRAFSYFGLLFLCSINGSAQINRDSLLGVVAQHPHDSGEVKAYVNLYRADRRQDPEIAFQYLKDGLALAQQIRFTRGEALVLRAMGDHYMSFGDPVKSLEVLQQSQKIYESLSDTLGLISCLNGMGNTFIQSGDHRAALEYFLTTAKLNERSGDLVALSISYQNIGGVHYRLQQFETALEFIDKSLAIKEETKDSTDMVTCLNSKSAVLSAQGNLKESKKVLLHTLGIAKKFSDPYEIGSIQNNLGVQYQLLGNIDSAKYYYEQSLAANRKLNVRQDMIIGYFNLGEIALLQQKGNLALQYYDSSLTVAKEIGGKQFEAEIYKGLAQANYFLGKYAVAYDWLEKHYHMTDSLTGAAVKMQINDLQEKYESGKKDIMISSLQQQEADARAMAERRKFWLLFAISAGLLVILATLWINTKRKAQEAQHRTQLEHKALRAQMNPHFIFNSLGAIQEMYMSGDTDLANNYLGDFGKLLRKILENSGKETTTIKEELEMLRLYLGLEKERNSGMIEYSIEVDERIDQSGTHIPPMVIQPIVENAIWHGILPSRRKGKIIIEISPTSNGKFIMCKIADNGVGFANNPKHYNHNSVGIHITEQRLGTPAIVESLSPGTRVTLKIPV